MAALLLCLPAVAGCALRHHARTTGSGRDATVVHLVDGDTVDVQFRGRRERVRLLGIDTPETKDPRKPVQCFGHEASDRLAALIPPGTRLRVERDVEARDRYGRLLLYLWRASDGLFVNLRMAEEGMAALLTFPPNVAHVAELTAATSRARASGLGLWGACGGPGKPLQGSG